MSSVNNTNRTEGITEVQSRRQCTTEQKLELVKQTVEVGMTVSIVARQVVSRPRSFSNKERLTQRVLW